MAKVKFPLEMANGTMVRNLDELKENFDIKKIVGYFLEGKLQTWLEERYYDEEYEDVVKLDEKDPELANKLCEIFNVDSTEICKIDTQEVKEEQEKAAKLKQLTDDDSLVNKAMITAFDQEELEKLYEKTTDTIYLCEGTFNIPAHKRNIRYVMIGNPIVNGLDFDVCIENDRLYINKGNGNELIDDRICVFTYDTDFVYYIKFEETKKYSIKKFNTIFSKTETIFVDENDEILWCDYKDIRMKSHNGYLIFNTYMKLYSCAIDSGEFREITDKYISKFDYQINDNKIYFISNEKTHHDGNETKIARYKDGQIICIDLKTEEEKEVTRHKDAFYIHNNRVYSCRYVEKPFGGTEACCKYIVPGNHFYISDLDGHFEKEIMCSFIEGNQNGYRIEIGCRVTQLWVDCNSVFYVYEKSDGTKMMDSFEISDSTEQYNNDKMEFQDIMENNEGKYCLILKEPGKKRLEVIKVIRENSDLGLSECKLMVDNAPQTIISDITLEAAKDIEAKLKMAGANVSISNMDSDNIDEEKELYKIFNDLSKKTANGGENSSQTVNMIWSYLHGDFRRIIKNEKTEDVYTYIDNSCDEGVITREFAEILKDYWRR